MTNTYRTTLLQLKYVGTSAVHVVSRTFIVYEVIVSCNNSNVIYLRLILIAHTNPSICQSVKYLIRYFVPITHKMKTMDL